MKNTLFFTMKNSVKSLAMNRLFAIALILFAFSASPLHAKVQEVVVTKVLDGDTVVLEHGETVRYIGVDAPQLKGEKGGEFFAREALRRNKALVLLKKVRLEFDVEKKDPEGRLLAYVYVKDVFVNAELVKLGFARAVVTPPNVKYKDLFLKYEKEASKAYRGLWQETKAATDSHYVGNKRSHVFHRPNCPLANRIPDKSRIVFRSRTDPIDIGYVPCKKCSP